MREREVLRMTKGLYNGADGGAVPGWRSRSGRETAVFGMLAWQGL